MTLIIELKQVKASINKVKDRKADAILAAYYAAEAAVRLIKPDANVRLRK